MITAGALEALCCVEKPGVSEETPGPVQASVRGGREVRAEGRDTGKSPSCRTWAFKTWEAETGRCLSYKVNKRLDRQLNMTLSLKEKDKKGWLSSEKDSNRARVKT